MCGTKPAGESKTVRNRLLRCPVWHWLPGSPGAMWGLLEVSAGWGRVSLRGDGFCSMAVSQSAALMRQTLPLQPHIQAQISRERLVPAGRGREGQKGRAAPTTPLAIGWTFPSGGPCIQPGWFSLHCVCNRSTKAVRLRGFKWLKALVSLKRE